MASGVCSHRSPESEKFTLRGFANARKSSTLMYDKIDDGVGFKDSNYKTPIKLNSF